MNNLKDHPYQANTEVHNFFFHPLHSTKKVVKALSVATNLFLTLVTGGIWQIPFWVVNRLDHRKVERWKTEQAQKSSQAAGKVFSTSSTPVQPSQSGSVQGEETPTTVPVTVTIPEEYTAIFQATPAFKEYRIILPADSPHSGVVLTGVNVRPANLFFRALFGGKEEGVTMPGSGKLFAFTIPKEQVLACIHDELERGIESVCVVSAKGAKGKTKVGGKIVDVDNLADIYGDKEYRINQRELADVLESQRIYTSSLLPIQFYQGLKQAMREDGIVVLPGTDGGPMKLKDLSTEKCKAFLAMVKDSPRTYGFDSEESLTSFFELTLYQIGSMVVKTENYHLFVDGEGKIREREVGKQDAIRLINACGIRGMRSKATVSEKNKEIMTETFKTALIAAEDGYVMFPAVGMGVWGGDPEIYWKAYLDAVVSCGDKIDQIFINPRHRGTPAGTYKGAQGEEFQKILDEYLTTYAGDEKALRNLEKIINLYNNPKDLVQLAYHFKEAFPEKTVSLFNASDPDVTLGNHVGEYTNGWPHTSTTEENYTAMGTNGLCFEEITGVHEDLSRLFQVTLAEDGSVVCLNVGGVKSDFESLMNFVRPYSLLEDLQWESRVTQYVTQPFYDQKELDVAVKKIIKIFGIPSDAMTREIGSNGETRLVFQKSVLLEAIKQKKVETDFDQLLDFTRSSPLLEEVKWEERVTEYVTQPFQDQKKFDAAAKNIMEAFGIPREAVHWAKSKGPKGGDRLVIRQSDLIQAIKNKTQEIKNRQNAALVDHLLNQYFLGSWGGETARIGKSLHERAPIIVAGGSFGVGYRNGHFEVSFFNDYDAEGSAITEALKDAFNLS